MKRSLRYAILIGLAAGVAVGWGTSLARKPPSGGGCPTPQIGCVCTTEYAPVICDGGCTYSNACVAGCAKATHCVPGDIGPQPL